MRRWWWSAQQEVQWCHNPAVNLEAFNSLPGVDLRQFYTNVSLRNLHPAEAILKVALKTSKAPTDACRRVITTGILVMTLPLSSLWAAHRSPFKTAQNCRPCRGSWLSWTRQKALDPTHLGQVTAMIRLLNLFLDKGLGYTWIWALKVAVKLEGHCQVLGGTWVHDVCQGFSVGCKVVNESHSGFKGLLWRARDSGQWKSKGDS